MANGPDRTCHCGVCPAESSLQSLPLNFTLEIGRVWASLLGQFLSELKASKAIGESLTQPERVCENLSDRPQKVGLGAENHQSPFSTGVPVSAEPAVTLCSVQARRWCLWPSRRKATLVPVLPSPSPPPHYRTAPGMWVKKALLLLLLQLKLWSEERKQIPEDM